MYNVFATFVNVEADLTVQSDLLSFIGQIVYAPAELFVKRSISNYTPLSVMVCQVHVLKEAGIPFLHKKDTKQNKTKQRNLRKIYFIIVRLTVTDWKTYSRSVKSKPSRITVSSTGSKAKSA